MNTIEAQAKSFAKELFRGERRRIEIGLLKERLDSKLSNFLKDRAKLDLLKILLSEIQIDLKEHELTCKTEDCAYSETRNVSIFLIEQEIDYINETYTYIPKSGDEFTVEEETSLHSKLNEISDRLNKQGLGQEILFDEIESLKSHFNLGKKTWLQLVYGKMISVTGDKMIEESVSKQIINQITDMFNDSVRLIP